jgi:acyl-CoA synthetase (AMP-forming)/AMP-acid ligase II
MTAEEILDYCRANLARYKVPSRIFLVRELPRTTVGKIDKLELRAKLSKES